ncbi:MAG: hypothetical protein J0H14_22525 [Alphaproteobacteria bacterium]|nr:hypothetical protein [Alphaproteobacteria bacterium]
MEIVQPLHALGLVGERNSVEITRVMAACWRISAPVTRWSWSLRKT